MFLAYDLAKVQPEHMLLGTPEKIVDTSWIEDSVNQLERYQVAINDATCKLLYYQLKPKVLKGEDILRHMVYHRLCNPISKFHGPSAYLYVMCTGQQLEYLEQDATDFKTSDIMSYSHGQSETMKLSSQILDILGYIKSYCGVQNDPKIFRKLKKKLEFSRSIIEIAVVEVKETADSRKVADAEIRALAPAEKAKLVAKDMDVSKLIKKDICSLLMNFYTATDKLEKKKNELVEQLRQDMDASQGTLFNRPSGTFQ